MNNSKQAAAQWVSTNYDATSEMLYLELEEFMKPIQE